MNMSQRGGGDENQVLNIRRKRSSKLSTAKTLFGKDFIQTLKLAYPSAGHAELLTLMSDAWDNAPDEVATHYKAEASKKTLK